MTKHYCDAKDCGKETSKENDTTIEIGPGYHAIVHWCSMDHRESAVREAFDRLLAEFEKPIAAASPLSKEALEEVINAVGVVGGSL